MLSSNQKTALKSNPKPPPLAPAQQELFDTHFQAALNLASNLYRRFTRNRLNHEREDFEAMALEALVRATRKWDPARGVLLWTLFNTIFRFMINKSYKYTMIAKRKCPTKIKRISKNINFGKTKKGDKIFTFKNNIFARDDRKIAIVNSIDQVKFLDKIAKIMDFATAERNWKIVKDHYLRGIPTSEISKEYKFSKNRVGPQILNEPIAKARKIAESRRSF